MTGISIGIAGAAGIATFLAVALSMELGVGHAISPSWHQQR